MTLRVPFKSENCTTVVAPQYNPVGTDNFIYLYSFSCSCVVCFLLPTVPLCKGLQYISLISFFFNATSPATTILSLNSLWPSTTHTNHSYTHTFCPKCLTLGLLDPEVEVSTVLQNAQ